MNTPDQNPYESGHVPPSPAIREYHPLRFFYIAALGLGIVYAGFLYLWNFDSHSERELMVHSFNWISMMAGGGAGYYALSRKVKPGKSLLIALGTAIGSLVGLLVFFLTIWPSL